MKQSLHDQLASKYAKAYLNVFCKQLSADDLHNIVCMRDFFYAHKSITFFLKLSALDDAIKTTQLYKLCATFSLPASMKSLIDLLLKHKRASLLPRILKKIERLHKVSTGIQVFTITSSHAIAPNDKEQIEQFLVRATGHTNIYKYKVDNALIAGVRLQSETLLWEHSIAKQLRQLEISLER